MPKPILLALFALTEQPYEAYNNVMPEVRRQLYEYDANGYERLFNFEQVLSEELPLTTLRRATRTAIKLALGEKNVVREYNPQKKSRKE